MEKLKDYSFAQIETFAEKEDYQLIELGEENTGRAFIVLDSNNEDITISFVLTGYNTVKGNIYTCIYSDLKIA